MLHARIGLITADPPVLGECVSYLDSKVRPAVEDQPGSLGVSLLAAHGCRSGLRIVLGVIWRAGDTAVPWLADSPGFRGALLFADPVSGHLTS
jgi:hypothetical protein